MQNAMSIVYVVFQKYTGTNMKTIGEERFDDIAETFRQNTKLPKKAIEILWNNGIIRWVKKQVNLVRV